MYDLAASWRIIIIASVTGVWKVQWILQIDSGCIKSMFCNHDGLFVRYGSALSNYTMENGPSTHNGEEKQIWERPWTLEEMRQNSASWSLAADSGVKTSPCVTS